MSEDKKSLINLVPDSVDNAVKNITDNPTQNIGTTLADIWYLVFGGISQAAEKRKLKYAYALQEFEKELKDKISKIPEDKMAEPDIQVIAPALEEAKYCAEKQEIRTLFINLIISGMNKEKSIKIHPLFPHIIKRMSVFDARLLLTISEHINSNDTLLIHMDHEQLIHSVLTLENLGLIFSDYKEYNFCYSARNYNVNFFIRAIDSEETINVSLSKIGVKFLEICT